MPPNVEPLSHVDAAWLGMEDPTNLMMVSGILTFDKPLDVQRLKTVLQHRFLKYERFRQRVVQSRFPGVPPYWEYDPNFDLDAHIHRLALPSPGDQSVLEEIASDLLSTPLDFSKPLWQIHLVERYGEGGAAIVRLHHCIADGMALVSVLLSLTDLSPDAALPEGEPVWDADLEEQASPMDVWARQASMRARTARRWSRQIMKEGLEAMIVPAKLLDLTLQGADHALAAGRLVFRSSDPKTIFKGKLGVRKRGVWSRPLPLEDIKAVKNAAGGTVNDVLVSALTGALRRYMLGRGESVEGLNFRAAVPVNLRSPEEMGTLGNKFGIVFLSLPVGIGDARKRLAEVRRRMDALKNTPEAVAAFGILNAIGMSPQDVQTAIVEMFGTKTTTVMTNVPGPPVPLYLAGSKIDGIMFWVPQSGRVGLGISIISYSGSVWLGVASDVGLIPDPETIIDGFYDEYADLMAVVRESRTKTRKERILDDTESSRCQARTKSGRRCRNRALNGSRFCRVHQGTIEVA